MNRFFLWWIDLSGKKRYPAGIAFWNESFGDYRLIVDCYPNRRFYLKQRKTNGNEIIFDLQEHILSNGKKLIIGHACSSEKTKGDIEIIIAPHFSSRLVLSF